MFVRPGRKDKAASLAVLKDLAAIEVDLGRLKGEVRESRLAFSGFNPDEHWMINMGLEIEGQLKVKRKELFALNFESLRVPLKKLQERLQEERRVHWKLKERAEAYLKMSRKLQAEGKATRKNLEAQKDKVTSERVSSALSLLAIELDAKTPTFEKWCLIEENLKTLKELTPPMKVFSEFIEEASLRLGFSFSSILSLRESFRKHPVVTDGIRESIVSNLLNPSGQYSDGFDWQAQQIQEMSEDLVLIEAKKGADVELIKDLAIKGNLFVVPRVVLVSPLLKGEIMEVIPMSELDEKVFETLCTLHGGEAYPTIREAKAGAQAIEGDFQE